MNALNFRADLHGKNFCLNRVVKNSQVQSTPEKRNTAALILPLREGPKAAPDKLLRQIESEGQAVAVSMQAAGAKLAYVAAALGKSESYISLIRAGKRPIPRWFIKPFCHITGTSLLQQYIDFQAALAALAEGQNERSRITSLASMLEAA